MERTLLLIVAMGMSVSTQADYVPETMPVCFDGESLKNYVDYVAYKNVTGVGGLLDAGRRFTVPEGRMMPIPENHPRKMAGGESPAITFATPKGGMTAWVMEVTVISA